MIEGIDNVQMSTAIDRQPVRSIKLTGAGSLLAETPQVFSRGGKLLHSPADRIDPQSAPAVEADARRASHVLFLEGREIVAETARLRLAASPTGQRCAVGTKLLHPTKNRFRRVDIARPVAGYKRRSGKECLGVWLAAKLAGPKTLSAPLRLELAVPLEDLNSTIALVGHIDSAVASDGNAAWRIKLPIAGSEFAPLVQ